MSTPEMRQAMKRFQRQSYDKEMLATHGAASADFGDAGPPTWSRPAWESFKAQYGFYPYSAEELPPTFDGAPDWVYDLMGLRKPPVTVRP